ELISAVARGRLGAAMNESGGVVPLLWDHQATSLGWKLRIDPVDPGRDPAKDALTLEFELRNIRHTSSYQIVRHGFKTPLAVSTESLEGAGADQASGQFMEGREVLTGPLIAHLQPAEVPHPPQRPLHPVAGLPQATAVPLPCRAVGGQQRLDPPAHHLGD